MLCFENTCFRLSLQIGQMMLKATNYLSALIKRHMASKNGFLKAKGTSQIFEMIVTLAQFEKTFSWLNVACFEPSFYWSKGFAEWWGSYYTSLQPRLNNNYEGIGDSRLWIIFRARWMLTSSVREIPLILMPDHESYHRTS